MSSDNMETNLNDTSCAPVELRKISMTIYNLQRNDNSQLENQQKHNNEAICEKSEAELRDEILFKQPECSHLGDCPICFLPLPIDADNRPFFLGCCNTSICRGCAYTSQLYMKGEKLCPFCRHPIPKERLSDKSKLVQKEIMKRVAVEDPVALRRMGCAKYEEEDYQSAFEYLSRAVDLGDVDSHYRLALLYAQGKGVVEDKKKRVFHMEEACIMGHPKARFNIAGYEWNENDRPDRAILHYIIAASQGCSNSSKMLIPFCQHGLVGKEVVAATLRAHQAAVDATKSPQRDEAERFFKRSLCN